MTKGKVSAMRAVIREVGQITATALTVALLLMIADAAIYEGRGLRRAREAAQHHAEQLAAAAAAAAEPIPAPRDVSAVLAEARRICEEGAAAWE